MRRNRGSSSAAKDTSILQLSTPVQINQNSNSCSNDTVCSSMSHSNNQGQLTVNSNSNAIVQNEIKIRTLLKELQTYSVKCQEKRNKSEPNLILITKTHDKVRKERNELSVFYRKKLRSLYATTISESEEEIKSLRQSLDCINQVRQAQNEIRLLQQQHSTLSSPVLNGHSPNGENRDNQNESYIDSKLSLIPKKLSTVTMRRGVLMSILQQAAFTLPLWVGEIGEDAPALCGNIPPEEKYYSKPGNKVAALVKNSNSTSNTLTNNKSDNLDEEDEEENWILAEVVEYHSNTSKYEVDDIDAEEGQERYTLSKKCVVPLPLWRANPLTDPDAIFPKDSLVLALYPQTTCFYRGIISESPTTPQEDYLILFEDNTYVEGYSPPLNVPQLYVVAFNDKR